MFTYRKFLNDYYPMLEKKDEIYNSFIDMCNKHDVSEDKRQDLFEKLSQCDHHPNKAYTRAIIKWYFKDLKDEKNTFVWDDDYFFLVSNTIKSYYHYFVSKNLPVPTPQDVFGTIETAYESETIGKTEKEIYEKKFKDVDFSNLKNITSAKAFDRFSDLNTMFSNYELYRSLIVDKDVLNKFEKLVKEGHRIVFEDAKTVIYRITNKYAAEKLCKITPWCISMKNSEYYDHYTDKGKYVLYYVKNKRVKLMDATIHSCYTKKAQMLHGLKNYEIYSNLALFMDEKNMMPINFTFLNNSTSKLNIENSYFPFSSYKNYIGIDLREVFEQTPILKDIVYDTDQDMLKLVDITKQSQISELLNLHYKLPKISKAQFINGEIKCGYVVYAMNRVCYVKSISTDSYSYTDDVNIDMITLETISVDTMATIHTDLSALWSILNDTKNTKLTFNIKLKTYKGDFYLLKEHDLQTYNIGSYAFVKNGGVARIKSFEIFNDKDKDYKLYFNSPCLKTYSMPRLQKPITDKSYMNLVSYGNYDAALLSKLEFYSDIVFEPITDYKLYEFVYILSDDPTINGYNAKIINEDDLIIDGKKSVVCEFRKNHTRLLSINRLARIKKMIK